MGNSCSRHSTKQIIKPSRRDQLQENYINCCMGIGECYLQKGTSKTNQNKWQRSISKMEKKFIINTKSSSLYNHTDLCLQQYKKLKPKRFAKKLIKGLPMDFRWSVWKNLMDLDRFYVERLYEKLVKLSSPWEKEIVKDLSRSFPEEPYFNSQKFNYIGQTHLFNVLKAISIYFPNIGYTQSMNFIVGFLLLVSGARELEVFWMFVALARDHRFLIMGLFEKGLPLLEAYTFIFYHVLETEMPEVYLHIKQYQLPDELWLLKWLMTIFIYSLSPEVVVRIWDYVLEDSFLNVVKVTLGILKFIEKDLITLDTFGMDQLFNFLKPQETDQNKSFSKSSRSNIDNGDRQINPGLINSNNANTTPRNNQIDLHNKSHEKEKHGHTIGLQEENQLKLSFKELDINKIISYARKLELQSFKVDQIAKAYLETRNFPLPDPYQKLLNNWDAFMQGHIKAEEFQREIDFFLLKHELSEPIFNEIRICDLLQEQEKNLILKDLSL